MENITEEQIDRLEETILLSEFQMKKGNAFNTEQVTGLDGRFHTILYEASGSRMLARVLSDFHEYVQSARKDSIVSEERARKSIREHKQILQAIKERDADQADREIAERMNMARRTVNARRQKAYRLLKELMGGDVDG